jgi:hypothetical protein
MNLRYTIALSRIGWIALAPGLALSNDSTERFETPWIVSDYDASQFAIPDHARAVELRPGVLGQRRLEIEPWDGERIVAVHTRGGGQNAGSRRSQPPRTTRK